VPGETDGERPIGRIQLGQTCRGQAQRVYFDTADGVEGDEVPGVVPRGEGTGGRPESTPEEERRGRGDRLRHR
jgi:hypothetical protein